MPAELVDAFANTLQPKVRTRRARSALQPLAVVGSRSGWSSQARSAARYRCGWRRPCLSALVSASSPMRSRWCSSAASRRCRAPVTRTCASARVFSVICRARLSRAPREVARLQRLRPQIHHRAPRLLQAVAQHLPRDVERLPRRVRRGLESPATASSWSDIPASPCSTVSWSSRATRVRSFSTAWYSCRLRWRSRASTMRRRTRQGENHRHHRGVAHRPPGRRREHAHVIRRTEEQPERGGGPPW